MANNNQIYKMSNAGGFKSLTRYYDMLAGNTVWNPWSPAGAYDALATINITANTSSITFTNIPQTYKHLQIREISRNTRAAAASNNYINFNGDYGANYSWHGMDGNGSSINVYSGANQSLMLGLSVSNSSTANTFSASIYDILDYANTTKYKTMRILSGWDANGSGSMTFWSGNWRNTAGLTMFSMYAQSGDYMPGSQFALYGVK